MKVADRIRIPREFFSRMPAFGLSANEVLARARLSLALTGDLVATTEQVFALWKAVGELSSDPAIGLRIGQEYRGRSFDPLSIIARSAPNFREALTKMARYKKVCGAEDLRVMEADGRVVVELEWFFQTGVEPGLLLDAALSSIVEIVQLGTGRPVRPELLELKREDEGLGIYEKHFVCPVRYAAGRNALTFSSRQADQTFITRNPEMVGLLEPRLESELEERFGDRFADKVRAVLTRLLGGSHPSMDDVASALNLSTRSLQRRLAEAGTRYQSLLEEVRFSLARTYLSDSSLGLEQIAYLVGYDEVNSFHRSFRAHEGIAPGQWRARQG